MNSKKERDWLKFWIHFVVGAFLGVVLGWSLFGLAFISSEIPPWRFVAAVALVIATIAGFCGDRFWEWLLKSRVVKFWMHWGWP